MEEKNVEHFKIWLFVIIITMIFVLGRITAHADETDTVTDILTSAEEIEHDYEYVIIQHEQSDTYLALVLSSSGCVVSGTTEGATVTGVINSLCTGMNGLQGGFLTEYCSYDNEINKTATPITYTLEEHHTIVYSSTDLLDSNNKVVFQHTPLLKQGGERWRRRYHNKWGHK